MAHGRVAQRVYALAFIPGHQTRFVTCGERHVKWWDLAQPLLEKDSAAARVPDGPGQENSGLGSEAANAADGAKASGIVELRGKSATVSEALRGATFLDVCCAPSAVFAVTSAGTLCAFDAATCTLSGAVELEADAAFSVSLQPAAASLAGAGSSLDALLAVGCSRGLVRLFQAATLRYVMTLPQPPPVGHLNVSSLADLTALTERHAAAEALSPPQAPAGGEPGASASALEFPACLALRWLSKPPPIDSASTAAGNATAIMASTTSTTTGGTTSHAQDPPASSPVIYLVAVYGDRSLFVWEVAASAQTPLSPEPPSLVVCKYRSFLHHCACVWDLVPLPALSPSANAGGAGGGAGSGTAFATCAADNTVRVWSLENGKQGQGNFFSKDQVHAFAVRPLNRGGGASGSGAGGGGSSEVSGGNAAGSVPLGEASKGGEPRAEASGREAGDMGGAVAVSVLPDLEAPCRVDSGRQLHAPRCLAAAPDGSDLACGDRSGNLRVWSLKGVAQHQLRFAAAAHDAEVRGQLCCFMAADERDNETYNEIKMCTKTDIKWVFATLL